jgi:VanZ family protein
VFVGVVVVTFVAALLPVTGMPQAFSWQDKAMHALAFAVLAALGWKADVASAKVLFAGLVVFGLAIEVAQGLTPTRQPELLDLVADAVGAAVMIAALRWLAAKRGRRSG